MIGPEFICGFDRRREAARDSFSHVDVVDGRARRGIGWDVTDFGCRTSRILDAKGAGSGVTDLQGQWWFWAER